MRSKRHSADPHSLIPTGHTPPGSETWNHYLTRAGAARSGLIRRREGQRILIAGHGETVDAAATLLLGLSPVSPTRVGFESAHASITRWNMQRNRFGQEIWILAALNDTRHLAQRTMTRSAVLLEAASSSSPARLRTSWWSGCSWGTP